jgi:pyruvate ferredoxin oxidoreductase gamma subunit
MLTVRIHGRGGQGVVTAAELLSTAAFADGKHALAFPSFGSERMGAPVMAFCRIDTQPIRIREAVTHPDVLIVQDPTFIDMRRMRRPIAYPLSPQTHIVEPLSRKIK